MLLGASPGQVWKVRLSDGRCLFDAMFLREIKFDIDETSFGTYEGHWVQQHVPGGPEALDKNYNRFMPTAGLSRNQSTSLLMFLKNGNTYSAEPVSDPWFRTTMSHTIPHIAYSGALYETWFADYDAIGTLACFEDDEICNPALENVRTSPPVRFELAWQPH
ncbi:hypothetical protein CERZMDRAFT_80604 [Cercospora zeae-maydis SCOH1-5]|uniref:Uncharacterized protein n=1 Tax=Cercospora zeae-maydis SCOH1-5 TaxID=717836 RepID=A0A6A6FXL4_9PEZI|nr:hypothetical protein CERZMDRAFT_80604 [Cercospora zeae-maydis SCOH1-5]